MQRLAETEGKIMEGNYHSMSDIMKELEQMLRHEPFMPSYIEGHDPGSAYWIMPVFVRCTGRIKSSDIQEYTEFEISINERYFDTLLTDFFVDGIDPDFPINRNRYSTDIVPEGVPIYGFEWYLQPNFYV